MECLTDCLEVRNIPYHFTTQGLADFLDALPGGGVPGLQTTFVARNKVDFPVAFVKCNTVDEAQQAKEKLNASYPTWKVQFYPPVETPKWGTTLVVTNLPTNSSLPQGTTLADWQRNMLVNAFLSLQSHVQQPTSIRIQYSTDSPSGCAYVQYADQANAERARQLFTEKQPGLQVSVLPRVKGVFRPQNQDTLKISGLAEGTDETRLARMCQQLQVDEKHVNCLVTGVKHPIGFVKYSSPNAASQANQYINIQLKGLYSEIVGQMPPACDRSTICVRGLQPGADEETVKHIMRQVGKEEDPTHVVVTGASQPVAYVRFANASLARLALVGLHQKFLGLDTEIVAGDPEVSNGDTVKVDGLAPGTNESAVRALLHSCLPHTHPCHLLVHGVKHPVAYARYAKPETARQVTQKLRQNYSALVSSVVQDTPAVKDHDTVRIQGLSPGANEDTVRQILRQVGVPTAPHSVVVFGTKCPTAYARYRHQHDAAEAVRGIQQNYGGLAASLCNEPHAPGAKDTLRVDGLPSGTTEASFLKMLRNNGAEPEFVLVHGHDSPVGYVRYSDAQTADEARQNVNTVTNLSTSLSQVPDVSGEETKRTLYIGKIGGWSESDVRQHLGKFGSLESVTTVNGPSGRFALVKFFAAADASRACDTLTKTHTGLDVYWSDFQEHLKTAVSNFWRDMDTDVQGVATFSQWYRTCRDILPLVDQRILREAFDQIDINGDGLVNEIDVKTQLFRIIRGSPSCDSLETALRVFVEQNTYSKKLVGGTACPSFEQTSVMQVQNKTSPNQHDVNEQLRLTKEKISGMEKRVENLIDGYGPNRTPEFTEDEIQGAFEKNANAGVISIQKHFDSLMRDLSKRGHQIHAGDIPKFQSEFNKFNKKDQANYREFRQFVYRVLNN